MRLFRKAKDHEQLADFGQLPAPGNVGGSPSTMRETFSDGPPADMDFAGGSGGDDKTRRREEKKSKRERREHRRRDGDAPPAPTENSGQWTAEQQDWKATAPGTPGAYGAEQQMGSEWAGAADGEASAPSKPHRRHKSRNRHNHDANGDSPPPAADTFLSPDSNGHEAHQRQHHRHHHHGGDMGSSQGNSPVMGFDAGPSLQGMPGLQGGAGMPGYQGADGLQAYPPAQGYPGMAYEPGVPPGMDGHMPYVPGMDGYPGVDVYEGMHGAPSDDAFGGRGRLGTSATSASQPVSPHQWQAAPMAYTPSQLPDYGTSAGCSPALPELLREGAHLQDLGWFSSQAGTRPVRPVTPPLDPRIPPNSQPLDILSWAQPQQSQPQYMQGSRAVASSMPQLQMYNDGRSPQLFPRAPPTLEPPKTAPQLDLDWAQPSIGWAAEQGRRRGLDLSWAQGTAPAPSPPSIARATKPNFEDPLLWAGGAAPSRPVLLSSADENDERRSEEVVGMLQHEIKTMKQLRDTQQDAAILQLQSEVKLREQQQAMVLEKMKSEMRERESQRDALVEKLQVDMRWKVQEKEALVFQLQGELREKEQLQAMEVQHLRGEIQLKEHERETAVEHLQGEIKRLREHAQDTLVKHLQEEITSLKEKPSMNPPALPASSWPASDGVWGGPPTFGQPGDVQAATGDWPGTGPAAQPTITAAISFSDGLGDGGDGWGAKWQTQQSLQSVAEDDIWLLSAEELEQYRDLFSSIDLSGNGSVGSDEARGLFERSALPVGELSHIWQMSDIDGDSRLTVNEFICAMALVARRQKGVEMPASLPPELLAQLSSTVGRRSQPGSLLIAPHLPTTLAPSSSTSSSDMLASRWAASAEELVKYTDIFNTEADLSGSGFAGPGEAKDVMEGSGLPVAELSQIWQTSDIDGDGRLSRVEFLCAMTIVARRLQGAPIPEVMPPELLASVELGGVGSSLGGASHAASLPHNDFWSPTAEELARYRVIFESLGSEAVGGGYVGPDEGRELLERSGLPPEDLSFIWRTADADGDGRLAAGEFVCAMTLVARRRGGAELPMELPAELLRIAGGAQAQPSPPPRPAQPLVTSPPRSPQSENRRSPSASPQSESRSMEASSSSPWSVSGEELERYRGIFGSLDTSGAGFIGPDEGKEVLMGSGLPAEELSWIWELSDVDATGQLSRGEFVVAMVLVSRRRRGATLPQELPAELLSHLGTASSPGVASRGGLPQRAEEESSWNVESEEVERYLNVFRDSDDDGTGFMGPDEGREVLESSGLPVEDLLHIWKLSDVNGAGQLAPHEFVMAMALAARRRQGATLPSTLPQTLVDSVNLWARRQAADS